VTPRLAARLAFLGVALLSAALFGLPATGAEIALPGISYEVLSSGPAGGAHPTRADSVAMRYVGRLANGEIFSTSPADGTQASMFPVNGVIPGMSAALQLMRPGDHWKISMPPYLAYGPGRPLNTPAPSTPGGASAAAQVVQKRGIPPNATLVFDVELLAVIPAKTP
jgi:FKBP-type peptidyl-prolyl cis-trans isomerase FklB